TVKQTPRAPFSSRAGLCRVRSLVEAPEVTLTLKELADRIGAELIGDPKLVVESVNSIQEARSGQVAFLSNPRYGKFLETTQATAVIVKPQVTSEGSAALLRMNEPYYG